MDIRKFFVIYHLVVLAMLIALLLGNGFTWQFFFIVAITAIIDLLQYVLPWSFDKQSHPEPASFFDRVSRSDSRSNDIKSGIDYLVGWVGFRNWLLFIAVWLLTTLGASSAGNFAAKQPKTYSIVETENLVVLKRYGDTFILRPINSDKVLVKNELLLWSQQDLANKSIKTMKLGKLRFTEEAKEKDDN